MLIRGTLPPYYTQAEIIHDTRGLHVNLETGELEYYSKLKMEKDPRWRNITDVFQRRVRARDIRDELKALGEEVDGAREDRIDDWIRAVGAHPGSRFPRTNYSD